MEAELVNVTFNLDQMKEVMALEEIRSALKNGKQVLWFGGDDAQGKVVQGVNGIFIAGHCPIQGTITMPLLWSDGKTFTRPLDEFRVIESTY